MRQQRLLHPIFAIDEPTHRQPPKPSSSGILKQIRSERNPIAPKSQAVFTQAGPFSDLAGRTAKRPSRADTRGTASRSLGQTGLAPMNEPVIEAIAASNS